MCRMCEMLHADPVPQNYQQMGEWWENNTCKLVVRYVKENVQLCMFYRRQSKNQRVKIGARQS
jgi:hypothetical protein